MIAFNTYFYVAFVLYTIASVLLFGPYVGCVRILTTKRRALRCLRRAIVLYGKGVIYGLAFPCVRVEYEKLDSAAPHEAPCVYICNHRSSSDPFLMACLSVELVQVVNTWPFRLPILGPVARLAGYLSVREMDFEEFLLRGKRLLEEGVAIVAFPEGTRSAGRAMGQFHGGVFRLCLATGATIIPVCITGNEDKPSRGSLMLRPGVVGVHCLPAITAQEYEGLNAFKLKNRVRRILMEHMEREEGALAAR